MTNVDPLRADVRFGPQDCQTAPSNGIESRMSNQTSLFSRIGRFFRRDGNVDVLPLEKEADRNEMVPVTPPRLSIFRPWAKRDASMNAVREAVSTLSELMTSIRDNLDKQGRRQDEMMGYLAHLPELMQALPEAQRMQAEAMRVIGQQLQQQTAQQNRLGEILEKVGASHSDQSEILENLNGRVETLGQQNQAISDNLRQVGTAMENVTRNSESGTQALRLMNETLGSREGEIQNTLRRQNTRLTVLMAVAIALSAAALIAAGVFGFMLLKK